MAQSIRRKRWIVLRGSTHAYTAIYHKPDQFDVNLCTNVNGNNAQHLSPHETIRRNVFNLQPITLNDSTVTCNDNMQVGPGNINFNYFVVDISQYNMESMVRAQSNATKILKDTELLPLLYPELFN